MHNETTTPLKSTTTIACWGLEKENRDISIEVNLLHSKEKACL
jgi:hypothetical protein